MAKNKKRKGGGGGGFGGGKPKPAPAFPDRFRILEESNLTNAQWVEVVKRRAEYPDLKIVEHHGKPHTFDESTGIGQLVPL